MYTNICFVSIVAIYGKCRYIIMLHQSADQRNTISVYHTWILFDRLDCPTFQWINSTPEVVSRCHLFKQNRSTFCLLMTLHCIKRTSNLQGLHGHETFLRYWVHQYKYILKPEAIFGEVSSFLIFLSFTA